MWFRLVGTPPVRVCTDGRCRPAEVEHKPSRMMNGWMMKIDKGLLRNGLILVGTIIVLIVVMALFVNDIA